MACVEPRALNSPPRNTPPCNVRRARLVRACARCPSAHRAAGRPGQAEPRHRRAVGHRPGLGVEMETPLRRKTHGRSPRRPGRGRKPHYGRELIERIVDDTVHRAPEQATHWSTRTMARHAGVSHTTVQRIWHAHELKPHLVRTFKLSNDKHFVRSCATSSGCISTPLSTPGVLRRRESQIQALDRSQPGLPDEKGRAGTMTHDYMRHGTPPCSPPQCPRGHRHRQMLFAPSSHRIPTLPARNRPSHPQRPRYPISSWTTTRHTNIASEALVRTSSALPCSLYPTSSSWLNLVERFFREITERRIRRGIFRSVRELTHAIYNFLNHYNENPRPFVWTKTADQILSKLAPLYANRG